MKRGAVELSPDEALIRELRRARAVPLEWPLIRYSDMPNLKQSTSELMYMRDDFCWAVCFASDFLAQLQYHGYLTMAMQLHTRPPIVILLPKLHFARCVAPLPEVPRPGRTVRKRAAKYLVTVDRDFDGVVAGLNESHGATCWMYPELVAGLKGLFSTKKSPWPHPSRVHTFEVYNKETGQLVAGEMGYAVGGCYTSLSGFTREDGAGTLQMFTMVALLRSKGIELWDLGMFIQYKSESFGGRSVPRKVFLKRLAELRDKDVSPNLNWKDSKPGEKHEAKEVLDWFRADELSAPSSSNAAPESESEKQPVN